MSGNNASYTAILRGVNDTTGIAVVEVYDLDVNVVLETRQYFDARAGPTGDTVLIAGTIVLGPSTQKVIVRAIGPSLTIAGKLLNPTLELRDGNGALVRANDDWRVGGQEADVIATTIPPTNDFESAIVETLAGTGFLHCGRARRE